MAGTNVKRKQRMKFWQQGKPDALMLIIILSLMTFGLVMLFSSSYAYAYERFGNSYHFISRQLLFAFVGISLMLFISRVNYHILLKLSIPIYLFAILALVLVLIFPAKAGDLDVKRWLGPSSFTFQPSEVGKFAVVVILARLIATNQEKMKSIKFLIALLLVVAPVVLLIVKEPHISAALLILAISAVLIYIGGIRQWLAVTGAATGVLGIVLFLNSNIIGYSSDRITYWRDPWQDPLDKGFQIIQSLIAIGSGGILGRGFGQSRQKYLWVPEPHNDFIFAIICEELGLVGAIFVIAGFVFLVWRGFNIAMRAEDKFGMLLCIGLTFHVGLQAMLNIWVVTNLMPNTGISLPFFSYGGSALIILLAEMGVVLSISRAANKDK